VSACLRCAMLLERDGRRESLDRIDIGTPAWSMRRRAYGATDSKYLRCASAYKVPKASEDFPEPDMPVNTTSASRGRSRSTLLRLCSRAPRTRTKRSGGKTVSLIQRYRFPTEKAAIPARGRSAVRHPDGARAYKIGVPRMRYCSRMLDAEALLRGSLCARVGRMPMFTRSQTWESTRTR